MKCPYCQSDLPNGAAACPVCGAPIGYGSQNQTQSAPYVRPPYPTSVEIIKETAKHKLFLAATILLTVHTALMALLYSDFDAILILMTIGAWMFYSEGRKDNSNPYSMNISSLKVLKATKTVSLVVWWIIAVAFAIILISMAALTLFIKDGLSSLRSYMLDYGMNYYSYGIDLNYLLDTYERFALLFLLLFVAILALVLTFSYIYIIGLRNYYKYAIESAETGLRPKKLSKAAPIMLIISASLTALSALDYLLYNPIAFFSYASLSVSMIFFAAILMDAKKRSDEAYYPNEAEVHYNKICYQQYVNAQSYGQFGGYAYADPSYMGGQYAQPPYQAPYNEPPQDPTDNQS